MPWMSAGLVSVLYAASFLPSSAGGCWKQGDLIRGAGSSVSSAPSACVTLSKPQDCFPIHAVGIVGPGHILLKVGARLLVVEDGHSE